MITHQSTLMFLAGIAFQALSTNTAYAAVGPAKHAVGYATFTARIVPLWLAQEQGFFTKYGIDVEPVFIRGAPTLVAGLAAGSIHIGRTGGSAEGLRNAQRLLKTRNPKVGEVKAEDVIDNRLIRKLDDGGFIDKLYAFYGASPK